MMTYRVAASRPNRVLILGRRHPGNFFVLFGKIMNRRIAKGVSGVRKIHFIFPDKLLGGSNPHLTEIFHGAQSCLFPEDPLKMRTADCELFADLLNVHFLRNVSGIIIGDSV